MHRKMLSCFFALAVATGAFLAQAEVVGEDVARAAAEGFLAKSSVAKRILTGCEVSSVEERGNLWIARLSPCGHVIIAGSDKCYPIVSFSPEDFAEPEADSPFAEKLSSDSLRVAEKESDDSANVDGAWAKLTAPVAKKRVLLAAAPHSADSDEYLAPFIGAAWSQGAPMNSFTPRNAVCGCTATAGGQELRYWRWPYRFEKSRTTTHVLYDASNNTSLYAIRMDGRVPFNYDKITDRAGTVAWLAADKEVPYNTAYLTSWVQSMVIVDFKPGAASGNKKLNEYADQYWYEKGTTMSRSRDGYTNLWNAIKADLDWGSPIQINTHNHQMVVVGYAVDDAGTEDEVDWVNVNFGWGRDTSDEWYNLEVETSESPTTAADTFADFQIGYHPQKIVQFEPVSKVCSNDVTLVWHMAPCYTNRIDGFDLAVVKLGEQTTFNDDFSASTGTVDSPGDNFKIENGYLGGYPVANQTSTYTYPEEFHISESSVLSFNAKSRYMGAYYSDSGTHTATVEVFPNNGPWETLDTIPLSGKSSWLIADKAIDLSVYAGKTIKLRFKFVTGYPTVPVGGSADFIIDNVAVTNIRYAGEKTYSTSIEKAADMPSVYSYDVTGLEDGCAYAFKVTPVMSDGADALTNFTTTRIGTPNPAPSIDNVSSVACGLELVQQGFYIECAREIINDIVVTCNESTTDLLAYPSHISALPDEKVSVTKDGNVFTVRLDACGMQNVWDGDMMLLTLVAKNADGTEASKNLMLRFNSMRQVLDGTFDVVEADADSAVWFCGTTTIDAKGKDVVFAPGVFMGTGNITLTDTVGGGSFTFQGLDGFTGTLAFAGGTDVAFQGDMSGFSGTIKVTGGTYTLSSDLPSASTKLNIVSGAQVVLDNASIACALSGGKSIAVSSGASSITSQILSSADILLSGGILEVALTEAEVAYGYSGSPNISISGDGALRFVDPSGNILPHSVDDGVYSVAGDAKVWSSDEDAEYSNKWINGAPTDGDYVLFQSTGSDNLLIDMDLTSDVTVPMARMTGSSPFYIDQMFSAGTGVFTAEVLENDTPVEFATPLFTVKSIVPSANVIIDDGYTLDCDLDQSLSGYIKKATSGDYVSALTDSSRWNGTVVFSSFDAYWLDLNNYGNQESKVRLNGVSGYLMHSSPTFNTTVELVDNGATPAFHWNDGAGGSTATFLALSGTGTFKTSGSGGNSEMIVINSIDDFAGSFDLASKTVAIGTEIGSTSTAGRLNLNNGRSATIALGKTWKVVGGVYLAGNQTLTVNGALNGAVTVEGAGTVLDLAPTASITAPRFSCTNTTIKIAVAQESSPAVSVTGTATLTDATIDVRCDGEMAESDNIALMTAASFVGVDTVVLSGLDGYVLEVTDGTLYAVKPPAVEPPVAAAVWHGNFSSSVDGYTLTDWQQTHGANNSSVTIDRNNQGLLVDFASAKGYFTVLVKYTNLVASSSSKRVLFATTGNSDYTRDRCGIRLLTSGKVQGLWNASLTANNDADYGSASTGTVPSAGTLAFVYDKSSSGGVSAYVAANDDSLPTTALWYNTALKGGDMYGFAVGGMCKDAAVNGVEAAQDMTISGMAVFDKVLSVAEMNAYEWPSEAPAYEGPAPIAVWVAGEFGDDKSAHGGLEFALNGNTTNALGQIVIGNSTTLGATVAIPAGHSKASVLVKYSIPDGAHVNDSVLASMFSAYDLGVLSDSGESTAKGYWFNGSAVKDDSYAFGSSAPGIPQEGYVLLSYKHDSSTAAYLGETIATLAGGSNGSLHFSNNDVTKMAFGGPTVEGAKPWAGMVIKSVAIFLDEYLSNSDLANYTFPTQGAVQPEDSDLYAIEPVARWVNNFKTTETNGCTLSVSGTTAVKDDAFGGVLTIGDSAAVIDTESAEALTVLVKYRSAPAIHSAPVVTFGGQAAVTFDSGICTDTSVDRQLAAYYSFIYGSRKRGIYAVGGNPTLSSNGGYLVCARKTDACLAYVGDSLDNMTGGDCTTDMTLSNSTLRKIGIGGQTELSNNDANMVPFTGFVVEKVVVFNGYYTPDQIRYIPNPEDGDTVNIAANTTWTFTASDTPREYKSVGTLSSSGTIAIANASALTEGTYPLATWTTPQQYKTECAGYGKVGNLVTDGLAEGLSARLVYGAKAIYLRVDDTAKQAARKPLVVWCYGDSITEGFNAQATGANYRILLYQKLEMLGYNVRSTGVYGLSNNHDSVDPTGTPLTDQYKWHSAKHGATAGPTTLAHRSNLSENVDTLAIQAGTPDVALLLIGVNDIPEWKNEADRVTPVFKAWTNVVSRMVKNLPDTKIVVSTILYSDGTRTDIDPTITNINDNYIKPLMANMPEAWQGHVVLADLNSIVKSGDPGIIYSDHLHPDWWGYDQMADGYLEKIVECYPDPDATDFPSQNPIPAAPTEDQLGAANKPELADYRAGFKKLCNIRVEKGQDVNNVQYDDINSAAASENLEKVGYFVEFVRNDNHAHKWVWVDMDAFGDRDLASVGLPQRIYQQAVTKMHVCSNHGAIDNVAADDDSVTGWIEFSPYNYSNTQSNSSAPENYGNPFDWNDTLSESGSYGCMQVFRVMNPSSKDLFERPQLMFAFNNFQSQNSNPADFGIGNFAQHFNCNNSYHTEDWTGVGGTLAKMAPDQYSVKTIEIWTKTAEPEEPETPEERDLTDEEIAGGNTFTRLNGKVYCGNDENRAVITNYLSQMEGSRPLVSPAPNTVDLLLVYDKPTTEFILNKGVTLEEFGAKNVAKMNYVLSRTDIDTNVWFRIVGILPLDVAAANPTDAMGKGQQGTAEGWEMVHAAREKVGADVVICVENVGGGMAYRCAPAGIRNGGEKAWAYAGVYHGDDTDYGWAWVHEVGHLASLYHNIEGYDGAVYHNDGNYPGCGFGKERESDNRWFSSIMNYGSTDLAFASANHMLDGEIYSITNGAGNYLDSTGVLNDLLPYMGDYYDSVVPEGVVVKAFPHDEAIVASGTTMTLSCNDPDATIWYYNASLGETEANAVEYSAPVTIEAGNALYGMAQYRVFAKKNGEKVTAEDAIIDYKLAGSLLIPDNPDDILDKPGLSWSVGEGWTKTTDKFNKGVSSYSITPSSTAVSSLKTTVTVDAVKTLVFHHIDEFTDGASFVVWVDNMPVWYKKGEATTNGEWAEDSVLLDRGSHTIEFAFSGNGSTLYLDDISIGNYVPSIYTWAGDANGNGTWETGDENSPWKNGYVFADGKGASFPDTESAESTVTVKGTVAPSSVAFAAANTAYTLDAYDENAKVRIADASTLSFNNSATVNVPMEFGENLLKITSPVKYSSEQTTTLALNGLFGQTLTANEGRYSGSLVVGKYSTVVLNPGEGKTQYVGDFGKNDSYADSWLVVTNGTVVADGAIGYYTQDDETPVYHDDTGLFQHKHITIKNGGVLKLATEYATGYAMKKGTSNDITVEEGGELVFAESDRLNRPLVFAGGTVTVEDGKTLSLYNNPTVTVTANSTLGGDGSLAIGGADATITIDSGKTLTNGLSVNATDKTLTLSGSGTFLQVAGTTVKVNEFNPGDALLNLNLTSASSTTEAIVQVGDMANTSEWKLKIDAPADLPAGTYPLVSASVYLESTLPAAAILPTLNGSCQLKVVNNQKLCLVVEEPEEKYTDTTDFPVPHSWIEEYVPGISGCPDAMYETLAKSPGDNGYSYWESYVLGLDPTNETSKLVTTIRMVGTTPVVEYSPTNTVLEASGMIRYVLQGSSVIKKASDWTEADNRDNMTANPDDRFFRVKVTW